MAYAQCMVETLTKEGMPQNAETTDFECSKYVNVILNKLPELERFGKKIKKQETLLKLSFPKRVSI